jgi:hypothetical protein
MRRRDLLALAALGLAAGVPRRMRGTSARYRRTRSVDSEV